MHMHSCIDRCNLRHIWHADFVSVYTAHSALCSLYNIEVSYDYIAIYLYDIPVMSCMQ